MESTEDEKSLGIEVFYTNIDGIGGKLKSKPEDFRVIEIPIDIPIDRDGDHVIVEVISKNWETNHLIRELAKKIGISRKRIGFAGTKDRRAVTTQRFSIYLPDRDLPYISLKDVEIRPLYRSNRRLEIGDLKGNRFNIVIRDIEIGRKETEDRIENIHQQLSGIGGFPNFYGYQRFGSLRPVTHLVGREIVRGNFDRAIDIYLSFTVDGEVEDSRHARERYSREKDVSKALLYYPKNLNFELAILNELRKGRDPVEAFQSLPKNLLMMFLYAYQSYLFNRILSTRIKRGLPLNEAVEGDIILPTEGYGEETPIYVTHINIEKVNRMIKLGRAVVTGAIIGYENEFADGEMGEIEKSVVDQESIDVRDFIVPEIPYLSSRGARRPLLSSYKEFSYNFVNKRCIEMRFILGKGSYATSLLREFMKSRNIRSYY